MRIAYLVVLALVLGASGLRADSEEAAKLDPVMGYYEGDWSDEFSGAQGAIYGKLIAQGNGKYVAIFEADISGQLVPFDPVTIKAEKTDVKPGEEIVFKGKFELGDERGGSADYTYKFKDGKLDGLVENMQVKSSIKMERTYQKPPTLGAKPPEGAIVLFDGSSLDGFTTPDGGKPTWKLVDGAMQVAAGKKDGKPYHSNIISNEKFLDHKLHVEFRTPYMPLMRGQARGNSGVYVAGNVEVQVLDSFGEPARDNEAGGIYKIGMPRANESKPPGEWQTYDIEYYAPKVEGGKIVEPGEITVKYNGKLIHDKLAVKEATLGGIGGDIGVPQPLLLQDHGNPVEFRNIWAVKIDPKKKAEPEKKSDAEKK